MPLRLIQNEPADDNRKIILSDDIVDDISDKNKEINLEGEDLKYNELNTKYIQTCSDFINFRKRVKKEKETIAATQTIEVLRTLLPLIDSLETGMKYEDDLDSENTTCILYRQLLKFFDELGVEEICDKGMLFNPRYNEAISTKIVPNTESGTIVTVLRKGYKYNHQIVRQSIVEIAE